MARAKLSYLLFDLPGDHEVESAIATESKVIEAIIHNLAMGARAKRVRVASRKSFTRIPTYRYGVQYVHLACHGGKKGISLLGGRVRWAEVGDQIVRHLHPLKKGEQRVMVFSCCYSREGYEGTKRQLSPYFSGAYYFKPKRIYFADAIAVWAMFYLEKRLDRPHRAIVKRINRYLRRAVLAFAPYK